MNINHDSIYRHFVKYFNYYVTLFSLFVMGFGTLFFDFSLQNAAYDLNVHLLERELNYKDYLITNEFPGNQFTSYPIVDSLTFYQIKGQRQILILNDAEKYMNIQSDTVETHFSKHPINLNSEEIAISENLLKLYNLKIGGNIVGKYQNKITNSTSEITYTIKDSLTSGLKLIDSNSKRGSILVGNNEYYLNSNFGNSFITYYKNEEYRGNYDENLVRYQAFREDRIRTTFLKFLTYHFFYYLQIFLFILFTEIVISSKKINLFKFYFDEMKILRRRGYDNKRLRINNFRQLLLRYFGGFFFILILNIWFFTSSFFAFVLFSIINVSLISLLAYCFNIFTWRKTQLWLSQSF